MTMPYGSALCDGVKSAASPARPCHICVACDRRLTAPQHVWQKFLTPPPAKHDGKVWSCEKRIARCDA